MLDNVLALLWREATLLRNNLAQDDVDFARHVRSVTTDVYVSLLLQQLIDQRGIFAQPVLNVDFLRAFPRECREELERVSELFLIGLDK